MKFIYPAIVHQSGTDRFEAYVPDLDGCRAEGFSLDDVMEELNHTMLEWITLEIDEGDGMLPPISDAEDLKDLIKQGDLIRNVCVTYRSYDGWDE